MHWRTFRSQACLYVAFSRVRGDCDDNIRVFVQDEQLHPVGDNDAPNAVMPVISNIVYSSEVLLH